MNGRSAVHALALVALCATRSVAYQAIDVVDGGKITGRVRFQGTPPAPTTIAVTKDPDVCGREKTLQSILVGADGGLQNAVVRLVDVHQGKPLPPPTTVTLHQKACEYVPRVLVFPAGSRVRIENDDGILHNTNMTSEINRPFTVAQPTYRGVVEKRIDKPEMPIRVRCDVHSWMASWWISEAHPYYALSDADGTFALDDVPPGNYTLEAWHETLGRVTRPVAVAAKGTVDVTLEMTKR